MKTLIFLFLFGGIALLVLGAERHDLSQILGGFAIVAVSMMALVVAVGLSSQYTRTEVDAWGADGSRMHARQDAFGNTAVRHTMQPRLHNDGQYTPRQVEAPRVSGYLTGE